MLVPASLLMIDVPSIQSEGSLGVYRFFADDAAGSFKVGSRDEYDCDFEICMMEVLHQTSYLVAWPLIKCVSKSHW